jgi:hypothetical protein
MGLSTYIDRDAHGDPVEWAKPGLMRVFCGMRLSF